MGQQGHTAELMKDIITIFYAPLAQVYKAASIADSLGDMQNFINDLIKTVDDVEECECYTPLVCCRSSTVSADYVHSLSCPVSQEDPGRTVQTFIDLVDRHEQAFYNFVHKVHSKGSDLFSSLMAWIEIFLDFLRDGIPPQADGGPIRIDLDVLLPHSGPERLNILKEVDAIAVYHYKLKVAHESKIRRKFLRGTARGPDADGLDADDEQALIDSIVDGLSLGGTMAGDAAEIEEEDEDSSEDDEDRERRAYDTPISGETGFSWSNEEREEKEAAKASSSSHRRLHLPGRGSKSKESSRSNSPESVKHLPPASAPTDGLYVKREAQRHAKTKGKAFIEPPVIRHLPQLLPLFVEMVSLSPSFPFFLTSTSRIDSSLSPLRHFAGPASPHRSPARRRDPALATLRAPSNRSTWS